MNASSTTLVALFLTKTCEHGVSVNQLPEAGAWAPSATVPIAVVNSLTAIVIPPPMLLIGRNVSFGVWLLLTPVKIFTCREVVVPAVMATCSSHNEPRAVCEVTRTL